MTSSSVQPRPSGAGKASSAKQPRGTSSLIGLSLALFGERPSSNRSCTGITPNPALHFLHGAPQSTFTCVLTLVRVSVLLQSPTHTVNLGDGPGSSKPLSPLEVAAIAAIELVPAAMPVMQAILFPGTVMKEVGGRGQQG